MAQFLVAATYVAGSKVSKLYLCVHKDDVELFPQVLRVIELQQTTMRAVQLPYFQDFEYNMPFTARAKSDLLTLAQELGVPLRETWSCYSDNPGNSHCGRCGGCKKRKKAFRIAGVDDPTRYAR